LQQRGDGETFPRKGQKCAIHYVATLVNKKKVDSSRDRGEPIEFTAAADEMIKGLDQHVMKMSLGERLRLYISADLAYGEQGNTRFRRHTPVRPPQHT